MRTNVGDEKHYGAIYQRFKERIRLPESYVDPLLSSRYAQHFYTAEERAQIRTRWLRDSGGFGAVASTAGGCSVP